VRLAARGLRDGEASVRVSSGVLLLAAGPASAPAREALEAALADADSLVRTYVAAAIGRAGAPEKAAPLLMAGLRSPEMVVRAESAGLLVELAPGRPAVVDALAAALKDPEAQVRTASADALGTIGPPARPALEALWRLLRDPDEGVRESALRAANAIKD
jgi:HEAT repeat protein